MYVCACVYVCIYVLNSDLDTDDPNYRHRGVAVVLSEKAVPAWKSAGSVWDPVSERILRLRMKSHTGYMSLIAVYAPTNEPKSAEKSDVFYEELQECVRQVPRGDMLLILGDFNARVGNDTTMWQGTIGRFCPAECNENGVCLLDFCTLNGLVVTNTLFQHRPCHLEAWFHPAEASRTGNGHVLDYILVNRHFRSSVLDTRVFRKTYFESDHRLLVSKLRLKLNARHKRTQQSHRRQVYARLLSDQQVCNFLSELEDKLATGPKDNVEEAGSTLKDSLTSAQSCLPFISEKAEDPDWVTDAVREVAKKKKEGRMRWQKSPGNESLRQQYHRLKVQSRQCADNAREEWWESKAEEAEKLHESAVRLGRGGSLLTDLRLLKRSQKLKAEATLCTQNGKQLYSAGDKLERWREHFAQVSNTSVRLVSWVVDAVLETSPEFPEPPDECDDSLASVPTEDEVRNAVECLKNRKAPGARTRSQQSC